MILNDYEFEFMFRKIRNRRNLSNYKLSSPPIVTSRIDTQNGFLPLFKLITHKTAKAFWFCLWQRQKTWIHCQINDRQKYLVRSPLSFEWILWGWIKRILLFYPCPKEFEHLECKKSLSCALMIITYWHISIQISPPSIKSTFFYVLPSELYSIWSWNLVAKTEAKGGKNWRSYWRTLTLEVPTPYYYKVHWFYHRTQAQGVKERTWCSRLAGMFTLKRIISLHDERLLGFLSNHPNYYN